MISYLLFYGGFFLALSSIITALIYTLGFNNYDVNVIHWICFGSLIFGIISPFFASYFNLYYYFSMYRPEYKLHKALRANPTTGFIQGVPNNNYSEFVAIKYVYGKTLILEYNDGVYTGKLDAKDIVIDMQGWILKDVYVYELIETMLKLEYINRHKKAKKFMSKLIKDEDIEETILIIKKGNKEKKYYLSNNKKIKSTLFLNFKNSKKNGFINANEPSIFEYYSLEK